MNYDLIDEVSLKKEH